ncbi:unnamed protein product [Prorocentrum cordatum]|uniref:Uncharacterized protein n=1 Tax=Prorocentrum cordatum TaxID=2364126 RepID=A0ABN9XH16_9DINO|nr:unnamed protein product [Polarella glacialis]
MGEEDRSNVKWWDSSPFFAYVLGFCVLFATVYNYVVMACATGKLGATLVTLFLLLQGVFACAFEWIFFGWGGPPRHAGAAGRERRHLRRAPGRGDGAAGELRGHAKRMVHRPIQRELLCRPGPRGRRARGEPLRDHHGLRRRSLLVDMSGPL